MCAWVEQGLGELGFDGEVTWAWGEEWQRERRERRDDDKDGVGRIRVVGKWCGRLLVKVKSREGGRVWGCMGGGK